MDRRWLRMLLGLIAIVMLADFVLRGIIPALSPGKNDFSEVYVGAWLWRHGQNFYDAALSTVTGNHLADTRVNIVLIYPPTALVLIAPLTFLSYAWANIIWLVLGLAAIGITIVVLIKLAGFHTWDDRALILGTSVLAFDPLHQAYHLGNVALLAVPLCLVGVFLAERRQDFMAGILVGIAAALKPQLGFWFLLFYLLQFRKHFFAGALLVGTSLATAFVRYPVAAHALISSYSSNLRYWFAPGRLYGFTEGSLPFHVNITQVIFYQALRHAYAANVLAQCLFGCGLIIWSFAMWRTGFRISAPLAISSLSALSFISLYHSVSDVTVLTLALCWAFARSQEPMNWSKRATCAVFLLLMLPGHSALMRLTPHLSSGLAESWWWKLLIARYFVWLLLGLNVLLLYAVVDSAKKIHDQRSASTLAA